MDVFDIRTLCNLRVAVRAQQTACYQKNLSTKVWDETLQRISLAVARRVEADLREANLHLADDALPSLLRRQI